MPEYISADALRAYLVKCGKEFDKAVSEHRIEQGTAALAHSMFKGVMDAIGGCDLPFAADVEERQHGHWIHKHFRDYGVTICSVCGSRNSTDSVYENPCKPYCPKCGAEMDEDEPDES